MTWGLLGSAAAAPSGHLPGRDRTAGDGHDPRQRCCGGPPGPTRGSPDAGNFPRSGNLEPGYRSDNQALMRWNWWAILGLNQ